MPENKPISASQVAEVTELSEFDSLLTGSFAVKEGSDKEIYRGLFFGDRPRFSRNLVF